MNTVDEVTYRMALSAGFLGEAKQDLALERWRSCVDNAQLAVENAGKVVLGLFGIPSKTHDPAQQVAAMLREQELPDGIQAEILGMLPDLLAFGKREHFLTDYGDETTYTLPWDLFDREAAEKAFATAQRAHEKAREVQALVLVWQNSTGHPTGENK